jgi:5'-3' exonuclease
MQALAEIAAGVVLPMPSTQPADVSTEIALIDLSSIAYPVFLMSGSEPDPNFTSREIVSRIRSLTATHPKAAICCDSGRSFRKDLNPDYKANRDAQPQALYHQIKLACEQLEADGYPVWSVKGFEADDLIATACVMAEGMGCSVLVLSADKDLLQLVGDRVRVKSLTNGNVYDREAVRAKFGVDPEQVGDYLALVGDASDNVKGAAGIGPKKAADLLQRFRDLDGIYEALILHGSQFKPAVATSLREFEPRKDDTRKLIELRYDVAIPFGELDNERTPKGVAMEDDMSTEAPALPVIEATVSSNGNGNGPSPAETLAATRLQAVEAKPAEPVLQQGLAQPVQTAALVPVEFGRELEPRSLGQALKLAEHMHAARLFNGYGTPSAVLSTILAGRELGLQAMASLRAFHIVEGRHMMSADLLRALVLKSGLAKYFRCTERTATAAAFETQRGDDPPMSLRYTIEEAQAAGLVKEKSGWAKNPADMLVARAGSKLARLVYPEIVHGLYSPEEFD